MARRVRSVLDRGELYNYFVSDIAGGAASNYKIYGIIGPIIMSQEVIMRSKDYCASVSFLLLFVLTLFFLPLPASAAETDTKVVPCDCKAYVVDPDPAGLNVRGGPGTANPVLATLPTNRPVEVTITGSVEKWMRISDAYIFVEDAPTGDITMTVQAWLYGPLLAVGLRPGGRPVRIFSDPDVTSQVLTEPPVDAEVTLVGCKGKWLKVKYEKIEGWLAPDTYCGNPVTTCP
jgi:SH3-like domain-containing protein